MSSGAVTTDTLGALPALQDRHDEVPRSGGERASVGNVFVDGATSDFYVSRSVEEYGGVKHTTLNFSRSPADSAVVTWNSGLRYGGQAAVTNTISRLLNANPMQSLTLPAARWESAGRSGTMVLGRPQRFSCD